MKVKDVDPELTRLRLRRYQVATRLVRANDLLREVVRAGCDTNADHIALKETQHDYDVVTRAVRTRESGESRW